MGTCEMCGNERISTKEAIVSNTIVQSCSRCIESMSLKIKYDAPAINNESKAVSYTHLRANETPEHIV